MENSFELLPPIMFSIPFDIDKHLAPQGRLPSEFDKEHAPESLYISMLNEYHQKNDNIMFSNIEFLFETCDCEYPCSHQPWISGFSIEGSNEKNIYFEDELSIIVEDKNSYRTILFVNLNNKNITVGDFHRIFKIHNVDLKLSEYAMSIIQNNK